MQSNGGWLIGCEVPREYEDLQLPLHYVHKTKQVDFSAMHIRLPSDMPTTKLRARGTYRNIAPGRF